MGGRSQNDYPEITPGGDSICSGAIKGRDDVVLDYLENKDGKLEEEDGPCMVLGDATKRGDILKFTTCVYADPDEA